MKYILIFFAISSIALAEATGYQIDLARSFSKEIFEVNGIPYLKPLVESVNSTSNSRFLINAYVPKKVSKPYFKLTFNGMTGIIRDDQKTFTPEIPMEEFSVTKMTKYVTLDLSNPNEPKIKSIPDTAALILYAFKNIIYDGVVNKKNLKIPPKGSTVFGGLVTALRLNRDTLKSLLKVHPVYGFLPASFQDSLLNTFDKIPEYYSLAKGGDLSYLVAGIPQLEIGSFYGTELLLRFIPPVDLGEYVGDFMFWGIGLKHSLSKYFDERYFDLAIQAVYQGTNLKNTYGITNSQLTANANIWNINLQFSKSFEEYKGFLRYFPDIYAGISAEFMKISSSVKYYMSVETQAQLGLLPTRQVGDTWETLPPDPANGFPGDTKPNVSGINLDDTNFKFVIGLSKEFYNFSIFADYNISQFNVFSGGIGYRF